MAGAKKKAASSSVKQNEPRRAPQTRARFTPEHTILLSLLVEARHRAGISQAELAARLGKVKSHVALIETTDRDLTGVEIYRWCEAVNLPFLELARIWDERIRAYRLESLKEEEDQSGS